MAEFNQNLLEYIKDQLKEGFSISEIKELLIQQGWSEPEVNDTLVEAQTMTETKRQEEREPEKTDEKGKKTKIGFFVSLIGGLLVIIDAVFAMIIQNFTPIIAANAFYPLNILTDFLNVNMLGLLFGLLMLAGAVLLLKGRTNSGGLTVLAVSVLNIVFVSINPGSVIGILGGIAGIIRK
jgi:DNA-binding transcriptional MerR regulator